MRKLLPIALAAIAASTAPALAHMAPGEHGSLMAGMEHPLSGADHMLAMVAVGLWAALLGGRAVWLVPSAFVAAMTGGFLAGATGLPLPFVEPAILASIVVIGLAAALALDVSAASAMVLVGFFAVFHGHAHGTEMAGAGMAPYAAGFALSTALLHGIGVAFGLGLARAVGRARGRSVTRVAGAATAAAGLALAIAG